MTAEEKTQAAPRSQDKMASTPKTAASSQKAAANNSERMAGICPSALKIRAARPEDAEALLQIYAPYVTETAITFEYDIPSVEEFAGRIARTLERYPYLAAEEDGEIFGYAYTGIFHERPAYDWSVETSIYVRRDKRKSGIGRLLYEQIERISREQHVINLNACIACTDQADAHLDNNSMQFHEHLGYRPVGVFHSCGYKFGTWYDMIWMEKMLGPHPAEPEPFVPFAALLHRVKI